MDIELLYRLQKTFEPGVKIDFFFENEDGKWNLNNFNRQTSGKKTMLDCLSPAASAPYYNFKKQAGFIIYKD